MTTTAGAGPGLASYHQSSPTDSGQEEAGDAPAEPDVEPVGAGCPERIGMVFLNLVTGETRPARCGRNLCAYCLTKNARRRGLAIAYARPQRELRLSLVADAGDPDPFQTARYRINKTREYLKRWKEPVGLWGWHVEPNPEGTGYHAHAVQHGPRKINKDALDQASFRAGAGLTRVRKVQHVDGLAEYGLKGAALAAYGLKGATEGTEYLRLNGGRLGHYSRGFFRSQDGETIAVRLAERLAMTALYGEQEAGAWTLMTDRGAASWASLPVATGRASATPPPGTPPAGSPAVLTA
jgi:hypothetical protein